MIAGDLAIDVKTAALLTTAYTFPYALVQPALGVTADFFGKTRLMNVCLLIVGVTAVGGAGGRSVFLLGAVRVAAGFGAGGGVPLRLGAGRGLLADHHTPP